jgi:flagella basal body P-ring formation protein FlgA
MIRSRSLQLGVWLVATVAMTGVARADKTVIALRWTADVPAANYTLGDIADIDTVDTALKERLTTLEIGLSPRHGYTDTISRKDVENILRQKVPPDAVEWRGAQSIRIRGRGQTVAAEWLSDAGAHALYAVLSKSFKAIEMQPVGTLEGIHVPFGYLKLSARVPDKQQVSRRMSVLVDVLIDGKVYTTVPVWFSVHASRPALRARSALKSGAPLRAEDFQVQMVDVAAQGGKALAEDVSLDAIRLRRPLEPGTVLSVSHVESKPSVARGERVAVRVVNGTITIETTGRALSDARIGDMVKVSNTSSNESFAARVVAEGVVQVITR